MPRNISTLLRPALLPLMFCTVGHALADNTLILEEVIVTAQKKSESLADTPMTVNVVTGQMMNEIAAFNFQDLDRLNAGLTVSGSNFDADIATRGLGTNLNAPVDPRVTVYYDGVPASQVRGLFSAIFDLARFELLRGPQGTLYGKSSPAGAITIQSRGPSLERMDGYVQQSFDEHGSSNSQFGVSVPLIENKLGLRIGGLYDSSELSDVENITTGTDNENETWAGRAVLLWEPTDHFSARLGYTRIEDDFDIDIVVDGGGLDFDDRKAVNEWGTSMENTTEYAVLEMNWELPNEWLITSVSSNQDNEVDRIWDSDGSEVQAETQIVSSNVPDTLSTELRLASQGNDFWDWTAGIYYQDSDSFTPVDANNYIALSAVQTLRATTAGPADITSETLAAFTHNAIHFSDNSTLTLGLRYTDIDRDVIQPFTISVFFSNPDGSYPDEPTIVRDFDGVPEEDQNLSDSAWTGTLKYQYRFNDELMAYASYDRGWRDGSANVAGRTEPPNFGAFEGEDSDNLEVGFKWFLLDGRGLLNMTAYYQIYSDFQYQADSIEYRSPPEDGGGVSLANPVVNVDEVESYGIDADLTLLLAENWSLNLAATYNQTEFTDAPAVPCTTGGTIPAEEFFFNTCDLEGERAGKMPEWSGVAFSEYWRPMGEGNAQWYLRGLLKAESEYYSQSLKDDLDSYVTLDIFTGLRSADQRWDVSLWARNLFDESALMDALRLPDLPDFENGGSVTNPYTRVQNQLAPRTVGITGSYHF